MKHYEILTSWRPNRILKICTAFSCIIIYHRVARKLFIFQHEISFFQEKLMLLCQKKRKIHLHHNKSKQSRASVHSSGSLKCCLVHFFKKSSLAQGCTALLLMKLVVDTSRLPTVKERFKRKRKKIYLYTFNPKRHYFLLKPIG